MKKSKYIKLIPVWASVMSVMAPVVLAGCVKEQTLISLRDVETTQNLGVNKTYNIHPKTKLKNVEFVYEDDSIVSATWTNESITIVPKNMGSTILGIVATDVDGNTYSKDIALNVQSKIHEFINERTFSLRITHFGIEDAFNRTGSYKVVFGTGWLFYHETDPNKKQSEYTYYLLTNNHVTNQFIFGKNCYVQTIKDTKWSPTEEYLSFAYQNWDDAKGDTKTIDFMSEAKFEGKSNEYNLLDYAWTNDSEKDNFSTLLSTYMNFTFNYDFDIDGIRNEEESYSKSRHYYPDMTFCKVDFGKYAGTELATRLDKLNEYADKHNNRLVEFDDYANTGTNKTLFVGGYPLTYLDQKMGTIYENGTKFQKYLFTNVDEIPTNNIDASLMSIDDHYDKHGLRDPGDNEIDDGIYDEKDEHDKTYSYNYCPYIEPQYTNEMTLKLGAGASGSLAMTAFDPLNPDTYKATGIYWGVLPGYFPLRYAPRFAPFSYNFGKNLPTEIENNGNLVKTFFDSDAFKKWKRTNKLLYDCQWHKSFGKRSARIVSFATTEGGKIIVNWPDAQIKISKFEDKETVFEKGPFTIDKDRSLTVDDLLNGQKVTITVIPDEHYKFATWKTNNNENPVNLECVIDEKGQCVYTFTLGEDNVGLTAVFEEKEEE